MRIQSRWAGLNSNLPDSRFQTETKGFPSGGKEHPSRGQTLRRVTVIMNIFHERRTASGTTTALPFESNALEVVMQILDLIRVDSRLYVSFLFPSPPAAVARIITSHEK